MKLFLKPFKLPLLLSSIIPTLFIACASLAPQYGDAVEQERKRPDEIVHSYYLIGNTAQANNTEELDQMNAFAQMMGQASKESTLVFLGNTVKKGMPKSTSKKYASSEQDWQKQLGWTKGLNGNIVWINGEGEWNGGYERLKSYNDFLTTETGNTKALLPRKGCGLERLKINEYTVLITVDSQWFLEDWDKHSNINEDCDIKTREDFFDELRGEINKNQNKVVLLAMSHPVFSNGNYGGNFSMQNHLFPVGNTIPLPVLGSIYNYTRSMSGISSQDLQSKKYNELNKNIRTIAQMYNNVIIVSGHEHNLQYIQKDNVNQVISGAMSNLSPARAFQKESFSAGQYGYAKIDVFKDLSAVLSFYGYENKQYAQLYETSLDNGFAVAEVNAVEEYPMLNKSEATASVYPQEWTHKTGWYRFLWGKHYRNIYGKQIVAPVGDLTKIQGGLTPTISGGGNQSLSLRMVDQDGKEFVMRGIRKSVSRFVQTAVFKDQFVMNSFNDTWAESFIYDFYTTAHPFTPFIIGSLSDKIGLFHTNPVLYYIPKQPSLGRFNATYGNELYMIEERPTSGFEATASFGHASEISSTSDVISNLRKDEKYVVDQKAFLRARIFDILIGDWDRHADQWRWSEFAEGKQIVYKPIPRDRDQAFAKIDGALLSLIKKLPPLRHMQNFTADFANPRWINASAFPLDQYLLKSTTVEDWQNEANNIVAAITDEAIDEAFAQLPKEVQNEDVDNIKRILKIRRSKLVDYLPKYYSELRKYVVLSGTDKKETFQITRLPHGEVKVMQYRDKKSGQELVFEKTYNPTETKEIWIYGLNDEDTFKVNGNEKAEIRLRLIGGKNQDTFDLDSAAKVVVYDYKDKQNNVVQSNQKAKVVFSNKYDLNNFNYKKLPLNVNLLLPNVGYNPEDGVKLGFMFSSTRSKFVQDPFTSQHKLKGFYSFNTQGLELEYKGVFPNATNNWMFTLGGRATSPNYAINFYGFGNNTYFFDEEKGDEYKRVRIQSYEVKPGYRYADKEGSILAFNVTYKALKVADDSRYFIASAPNIVDPKVFDFQQYGGIDVNYKYEQYNYKANPTVGFKFNTNLGWKMNLGDTKQNFPYLDVEANFIHYIDRGERLILATNFAYQTRLNNKYDFYDAATIGGNGNLRGFRPERFTGKTSYVQTTDVRYNLGQFTAGFIPMSYGVYGGFDYGRVWQPEEYSNKWHNSYGAGIWVNAIEQATLHCSYFSSVDGGRFVFGLGFGF